MRGELRRLRVSYDRASGVYYNGDKKHLKQAGHTLVGRGVADLIEASLRGARAKLGLAPGTTSGGASSTQAYPRHARASGSGSGLPQTEELCFLWYRSGLVDRRLAFASAPGDADADPDPPCTPAAAAAAAARQEGARYVAGRRLEAGSYAAGGRLEGGVAWKAGRREGGKAASPAHSPAHELASDRPCRPTTTTTTPSAERQRAGSSQQSSQQGLPHGSRHALASGEEWHLGDFSRGARLRQEVGTKEVGKWAFLIDAAHNATPLGRATTAATLSLHFTSTRNHSGLFVAHMLDCCIYGTARAALDGKPFGPLLHGSSPGFIHHVLHAQRLGSVAHAGRHRLSFRLVRASPTGAQLCGKQGQYGRPTRTHLPIGLG